LPPSKAASFGIDGIQKDYSAWFGVGLIASSCLLTVIAISKVKKTIQHFFIRRKAKQRLHVLTREEKNILSDYIILETKTRELDVLSGVVSQLVSDGIIYQTRRGIAGDMMKSRGTHIIVPHNIQGWAWDYLNTRPYLVGLESENQIEPVE
jgi:hypothetical protein